MAKRAKPIEQNFGRVIYLTLIRRLQNNYAQNKDFDSAQGREDLENLISKSRTTKDGNKVYDNVTICFDPWREDFKGKKTRGNLNTRIDFYVKHLGEGSVGNNGYYATANIDVWNIGPALEQFLDVYNAYTDEGHYVDLLNTKKYAAVLQVGFRGSNERHTVFAGHISSFVLERQQSNTTVDNVWHFLCQYPDPQRNEEAGLSNVIYNIDTKTGNYKRPYWNPRTCYSSLEEYLKRAICAHKTSVLEEESMDVEQNYDSFEISEDAEAQMTRIAPNTDPVKSLFSESNTDEQPSENRKFIIHRTDKEYISYKDFNKHYEIYYSISKSCEEFKEVKELWKMERHVATWQMDVFSLKSIINEIASMANCHGRVEPQGNKQVIFIYPAGWAGKVIHNGPADYTIVDYQNLKNPPRVAANVFHLDMIMEPDMRPGSVIALELTQEFKDKYQHFSFEPAFGMGNTATVFAGARFVGLAELTQEEKQRQGIASAGNIFNKKFVATIVEHRGSSHTAEWTTSVDCYGVVSESGEVKTE